MNLMRVFITLVVSLLAAQSLSAVSDLNILFKERDEMNKTVWSDERKAQEHERYFISLWDELRAADDPFEVFKRFPVGSLNVADLGTSTTHEYDIKVGSTDGTEKLLDQAGWSSWLDKVKAAGFQMPMSEWHHDSFSQTLGQLAESVVSMKLYVEQPTTNLRAVVSGKLKVTWQATPNAEGMFVPKTIDASELTISSRIGEPFFKELYALDIPPKKGGPLLTYDLNRDGLPEILLPEINTIFWNLGENQFGGNPLHPVGIVNANTAILGDFSGDGYVDLISIGLSRTQKGAIPKRGLFLYTGNKEGKFEDPIVLIKTSNPIILEGAPTMTTGDIDGDGDLDVFIGQYKELYLEGAMPTPYYDALDGYPAYLLLNDGDGTSFTEVAEKAGISEKRNRRTFSSSFFDYDYDQDLDLLVVSDFAGVDLYENDGSGNFTDVTDESFYNRHLFGMAHSIEDYNNDGLLDLYAIGMSSTTARRLDHMDAGPEAFPGHNQMRASMGYGNRLYLGKAEGGFSEAGNADELARSGWSWGVGSLDFDNDGDKEIYVANGHYSNETAQDYCTYFWTDDIYRGDSQADAGLNEYFAQGIMSMMEGGMSWNGFEKNVLFMPMNDGKVRSISFLFGLAEELDSRQVTVQDMDGDGRVDIIYSCHQPNHDKEKDSTVVKIIRNQMPDTGNWVGIRLAREPGSSFWEGAKITVESAGKTRITTTISGDSHQAQHAPIKHFGLGQEEKVDAIEVIWADGKRKRLENPAINQYHDF